ncbi:MAG: MFS transporter [Pirellulales bacterium]|nr:MFS transporter [Pirellulales bacterium]
MTTTVSIARRLERLPITRYQRTIFIVIATAWFFDCVDLATMTFILSSITEEFSLSPQQAGMLAGMSFLGMFLGAGSAGILADRFGRCVVFRWSIVLWGISSLACAAAPNIETLMCFRVLLGVGLAMELPVAQSLVCEFIPTKQRGKYVAFLEGGWPLGFIAAGILALVVVPHFGWRGAFVAEAIPAFFVLVIRRIVPESPRWLAETGKFQEAEAVLATMESKVKFFLQVDHLPEVEATPEVLGSSQQRPFSFFQLWQGDYAQRTCMVWILWFFALLGYYGLTTWLGALLEERGYQTDNSTLYVTLMALAGIPGFLVAAYLLEAWGRKPVIISALIGAAVLGYCYGTATSHNMMIVSGLGMQFFMFGMWSVIYAYTPELYPTHARATGAGFASSVGRLGAFLGPTLVGVILPQTGQPGVFMMAGGSFFIAALAVLLLGKETKGILLEEI